MSAMVQNDTENEWMAPLLKLRNELDQPDREIRDFRRMGGNVTLFSSNDDDPDRPINVPGPYTQNARAVWLRKLLTIEHNLQTSDNTPENVRDIELISLAELDEIRKIWVLEKHEIEDILPEIYKEVKGFDFPGKSINENQPFMSEDLSLLKDLCEGDDMNFELVRGLLDIENKQQNKNRRSNLFKEIENIFNKTFYEDAEDAISRAKGIQKMATIIDKQKNGELNILETLEEVRNNIN
jgi:DNA sulfur modification protein DndC